MKIIYTIFLLFIITVSCGNSSVENIHRRSRIISVDSNEINGIYVELIEIDGVEFVIVSSGRTDGGVAISKLH